MAAIRPRAIAYALADGWQLVSRKGSALVTAEHPASIDGFTAVIDLAARPGTTGLDDLADESVHAHRADSFAVWVERRAATGNAEVPGLLQVLGMSRTVGTVPRDVVRHEAYLELIDTADAGRRLIIEASLTATSFQYPRLVPGYLDFLASIRLVSATEVYAAAIS